MRRIIVFLISLVFLITSSLLFLYSLSLPCNDSNSAPGIYLEFKVPIVSRVGIAQTCVYIEAILPKPPDFLLLDSNCYRGLPVIHIPYDKVKDVVDQWVLELINRGTPEEIVDKHSFSLLVRAYMMSVDGRVLHKVLDSITLRLGDFRNPQQVKYVIQLNT